jgi:hypothetical protein
MNGHSTNDLFGTNIVSDLPNGNLIQNGTFENAPTFGLAPGAERHANAANFINNNAAPGPSGVKTQPQASRPDGTLQLDYTTDFPKLPDAPVAAPVVASAWAVRRTAIPASVVTETLSLRPTARASTVGSKGFGNVIEEQNKCNQIASQTGTKIELSESKDKSLTILITGKRTNVEEARTKLMRELQTQSSIEVAIPKEYHGFIIGKEGSNLRKLEQEYACSIVMPKRDDKSDLIKIVGPAEYMNLAAARIKQIGDEMSKQGTEVLAIPRTFYPWIRGPFNEIFDRLSAETGAKINIPPPNAKNENIVINGEKTGVERAAATIRAIYEQKKDFKSVTCKVAKAQHRFILGTRRSGLDEILRETDVVVDVPPEDDDSDVITLRGDPARLGDALALVYAKASSVISQEIKYPEWMRKFLIGPKGATLQALVPKQDRLKIDFEDGGLIYLEGPPEAVKSAAAALSGEIGRLTKEMSSESIHVPPALHRHIIGRSGALVNKLKDEHDVQIRIPNEKLASDEIKIEGKKDGVQKTIAAIQEIVKRLENEKVKDIIIDHRFHGQMIGKSGENIQKWKAEFPSVAIAFPDAITKSDVINLRGEKKEVDKLYTVMSKLAKDLQESNYQESVPIFKEYFKHIIGRNGANINKIREETFTRIEFGAPGSSEGRIMVIGKQANVEKAIEKLNKIQNELASIVTVEVPINAKIHPRLLANGRRLIRDIEDEHGGVHILFPKEKSGSDKVVIRGPKNDVAAAEKALKEVAKHCEETTEEASITTKPEYIRFLIGREGANIKKLREKYPNVRIMFPTEHDNDNKIWLLGKTDEVEAVKKIYEKQITDLNETVEIHVNVDPKWHRHFVLRNAEVIREIQDQNGGVIISFPRQNSNDSKVSIKGSKNCVESAKERILEIVDDLESEVTINVEIPEKEHRALVQHAQEVRSKFNVRIRFPQRGGNHDQNEQQQQPENGVHPADLVQISGRDTKCEEAKQALLALIPISKSMTVPAEYHSSLIGRKGESVRELMSTFAVRINIPAPSENSEEITITGTVENVEAAIQNIREKVEELDKQIEDRKLRSHAVKFEVPLKYHQRLIGPGGASIRELSSRHDVQITIPRSDNPSETITVTGYETNANACKDEIVQLIQDLESMFSQEMHLDPRFHPRLIGQRGRNLRKVQDEYQVEIRLPGRGDPDPSTVIVSGKVEEHVYDCIDKLRAMEEDYITDLIDRGQYLVHRNEAEERSAPKKVEITGAPWQLDNDDQFPAMSNANQGQQSQSSSVWGKRPW